MTRKFLNLKAYTKTQAYVLTRGGSIAEQYHVACHVYG